MEKRIRKTFTSDKEKIELLNEIRNIAFREYDVNVSGSRIIENALHEHLLNHFMKDINLEKNIKAYLSEQGLL